MHLIVTAAVIGVLIVVNLLNNKWATKHYLMICFVATASLIAIARISGLSWEDLGLARDTWLAGVYWSAAVFGAVALFYAIAASLHFARCCLLLSQTVGAGPGVLSSAPSSSGSGMYCQHSSSTKTTKPPPECLGTGGAHKRRALS